MVIYYKKWQLCINFIYMMPYENIVAKIEEDPKSAIFLFIKMRNILVL